MSTSVIFGLGSVILVSLVSLAGVLALSIGEAALRRSIFFLVSLAAGALFGDAFLHLIPEAIAESGRPTLSLGLVLAGIIVFFLFEKVLRWRHSHGVDEESRESGTLHDHSAKHLGTMVLVADTLHNFIDGVIIGVSFMVGVPVGIATTVAVILHEIPQEIGDFGLLIHAGFGRVRAILFNLGTALLAVVGFAVAFLLGERVEKFIPAVSALAAGTFIYIAGSDLVPEINRTSDARNSILQVFFMLVGLGFMALLLVVG